MKGDRDTREKSLVFFMEYTCPGMPRILLSGLPIRHILHVTNDSH